MLETGLINRPMSDLLMSLGHTDCIAIADAGLPLPVGVPVVDVSLKVNMPTMTDVLEEVLQYFLCERYLLAAELERANPSIYRQTTDLLQMSLGAPEREIISHEDLKRKLSSCKGIIRTGDFHAYSNALLYAGSSSRFTRECT